MFTNWVTAGGNLIAMRPDKQLASLLGLTDAGTTLADGYMLVNTAAAPGAGIVGRDDAVSWRGGSLHGRPARATVATLYSNGVDRDDQSGRDGPNGRQRGRAGRGVHL